MKQVIPIIAVLVLLAACVQMPQETTNATNTTTIQANLTVNDVLGEFEALDAQYNTSWMKEQIPKSMINPKTLQQWTDRTLALKNITMKNTLASELIDARLEMLSAQTAIYLGVRIGEKGAVPLAIEEEHFIAGRLNCNNIKEIAEATRLYQVAFHSWERFGGHMDTVLQDDIAARPILGVNNNRMPFYQSSFQKAREKIEVTAKAVEEQCGFKIKLEPEPEIPPNLLPAGAAS